MSNYYDGIAHHYDVTRPLPKSVSDEIADCILQLVQATPETTFLEPGIGTGRTALPIILRGYAYTGVDISQEMMDQLRQKLQGTANNLQLIQADASSLPFDNHSFDVVLTTHILQCLPNWRKGLSEIRRVLKPKGFYLACENLQTPHQRELEAHFRRILAQYQSQGESSADVPQNLPPSPFGEGMKQVLLEQGARVKTVTAARWQVEQTVGELLNAYQSRAYGVCWSVPDDIFFPAMQEFISWCQQQYGSTDFVLSSEATFDIIVARGDR